MARLAQTAGLTEIQTEILSAVKTFVDKEIIPHATELEHKDEFPEAIVEGMKEMGLFGLTIPEDLTPKMQGEMTDFVGRELLTDHWMRAQSLSDIAASQSNRPDHGPMGAFCAWPAETAAAIRRYLTAHGSG